MTFRIVNGSMYTEAGWRCCDRNECDVSHIPELFFMDTAPLRMGPPHIILSAWCFFFDRNIQEIDSPVWGWSQDNDVLGGYAQNNGSNHLSGTAVDINAPKYPWGLYRMAADIIAKVEAGLDLFNIAGERGVFWGRYWDKPDEMHFQMAWPEDDPRNVQLMNKLLSGYLGIYGEDKGDGETPSQPTVPNRKPVVPGDGGAFWSDVSHYQTRSGLAVPIDDSYQSKVFSFRTNSGSQVDNLAIENATRAKALLDAGKLEIVIPYYFFRPGQENCDLHRELLEDAGLFNHPRTVTMVDVEDANGAITGNHSVEINDEVDRIRKWYNNPARVIGYLNPNANLGLWPSRPGINLVIPQYNLRPGDLTTVKNQSIVTEAIAHQYTSTATNVAPWQGLNTDRNWSPYSVDELLELFGMKDQPAEEDSEDTPMAALSPEEQRIMFDKVNQIWDQLLGPNAQGWPQLGNKTPVDAIADIQSHFTPLPTTNG